MKDEVDFLPADKCQMFPQIDTNLLGVWPGMPKLPKITSLLFLFLYLKKEMSDDVDFFVCRQA